MGRSAVSAQSTTHRAGAPAVMALLAIVAFYLVGYIAFDGFLLDLGSLNYSTPRYVSFVACWVVFGSYAARMLALSLSRWGSTGRIDTLVTCLNRTPERRVLLWACSAACAIPLSLRFAVMNGAPLTDDEGAYRFAAQLLASGRLWVPSPEMKLFFDQNFMINDGRLYPAYFLGWPAILAIGELIHAPGLVNPVLSALTIPAVFHVLRHFVGRTWAIAGVVLFLTAPFVQISASTLLSHTSCLAALAWCLAMYLRTTEPDASTRTHAAFGFFLGVAFWIRPQSSVGIMLPLLVLWTLGLRRLPPRTWQRALIAFALPSAALAALFLATLWAQNGSPWLAGYVRYEQYVASNAFRFTTAPPEILTSVAGFDFTQPVQAAARTAMGMLRLNFDLFGWPSSFKFILLGLPWLCPGARLMWAMVGSYLLLMFFQRDWGIDTFGPMHAFELTLPILVLTMIGVRELTWRSASAPTASNVRPTEKALAPFLFVSLIVCAWIGFIPVRLKAVNQIAAHVNVSLGAPEKAGLHRAVIFAPLPFAPRCGRMPEHFVNFRPVNDPDLRNDVLWVNHVDLESDRRFMSTLPSRTGYLMDWTPSCEVTLLPLNGAPDRTPR